MKIGLSSYSLLGALNKGELDFPGAVRWAAEHGAAHLEIVPCGKTSFSCPEDPQIAEIRKAAEETGIDLSSYTIAANFVTAGPDQHDITPAEFEKEIVRIKKEIDIAAAFGVHFMRHDAGWRSPDKCSIRQFEKDLPLAVKAFKETAGYAKQLGITLSVENHGYLFQGSERIHRLVDAVGMENFRTTMDVGNFLCVDEDPVCAVMNNIDIASFIHFKDFCIRKALSSAEGWLGTYHGRFIRGSVTGFGDVDLPAIAKIIRKNGYDGYISIEYEGAEECKAACAAAIKNVQTLFA